MAERPYVDFKLYLTKPDDDQVACQVALLPTPEVGESMEMVSVPAEKAPDPNLLKHLARKSISGLQLLELGKSLADCLLPEGQIRQLFREAHKHYGNEGGVRLRLIIADNALRLWPWEYTYLNLLGGKDGWPGFLALDPRVSFVRHEPLAIRHSKLQETESDMKEMRLLMATAQPAGTTGLELEHEVEIVQKALADFEVDDVRILCEPIVMDATRKELAKALQRTDSVYLFHFSGHGVSKQVEDVFSYGTKQQGYLLLVQDVETKEKDELEAEELADMLAPAGVRLVVLGACLTGSQSEEYPWSSVAGALVANNIPAVVAMQYEVIDDHAIAFSDSFYTSLASGLSLDEAMAIARQEMFDTKHPEAGKLNVEWGVPVLYSRTVDGNLFPERTAHPGPSATKLRNAIRQTVDAIEKEGKVVGARVRRIKGGGISVEQAAGTVSGEMTGLIVDTIEGGNTTVDQDVDTVKEGGEVTGLIIDEI